MRKFMLAASIAALALAAGSAAMAAPTITFAPPEADGSFTGTFGNAAIDGAPGTGVFNDTYTFMLPTGMAGFTISSTFNTGAPTTNIDFTSVSFNGANFQIGSTGQNEYRFLNNQNTVSGNQTLLVNGVSGGNGSYSGTLAFSRLAGVVVPEPATWAMMLIGFGGVGSLLRSRRRTTVFA